LAKLKALVDKPVLDTLLNTSFPEVLYPFGDLADYLLHHFALQNQTVDTDRTVIE
jgi:hypothetical protein